MDTEGIGDRSLRASEAVFFAVATAVFLSPAEAWPDAFRSLDPILHSYLVIFIVISPCLAFSDLRAAVLGKLRWSRRPGRPLATSIFRFLLGVWLLFTFHQMVLEFALRAVTDFNPDGWSYWSGKEDSHDLTIIFNLTLGGIFIAVAEELYARVAVRHVLERWSVPPMATVLAAGVIFGMAHLGYGINYATVMAVSGSVWMVVYLITNNIWLLIVAHYLINMWEGLQSYRLLP